jgi:hypothetical protein
LSGDLLTEKTMPIPEFVSMPALAPNAGLPGVSADARSRACACILPVLIGVLVVAAPVAFVALHRSPLPEEALVVGLTGWPNGVLPQAGERAAR